MRKILIRFVAQSLIMLALLASPPVSSAESMTGTIVSRSGVPVAGLTVQLAHPTIGRSIPAITDSYGQFKFINVPATNDAYYLEVYWGLDLVYSQRVVIRGNFILDEPIRLP
jgi:carboxypeptidase family protein